MGLGDLSKDREDMVQLLISLMAASNSGVSTMRSTSGSCRTVADNGLLQLILVSSLVLMKTSADLSRSKNSGLLMK